jgi:hypothetical protein
MPEGAVPEPEEPVDAKPLATAACPPEDGAGVGAAKAGA